MPEKNWIIAEDGEKFESEEADELARRVRKLSPRMIDELWFRLGWIELESGNKALPESKINKIITDQNFAANCVADLLQECGTFPGSLDKLKKDFIEELTRLENNKN